METDRKALYNSLRMHWKDNPDLDVEPWQVEDYRSLAIETLFQRIQQFNIHLDKNSFVAYAQNADSPEDLFETLVDEEQVDGVDQDQIFLLLFELWRRLQPESRSLSIFCDELDHQIDAYDRGELKTTESLEYCLAQFEQILEENTDEGEDPIQMFDMIGSCCANDIETFLYDYISQQIDVENTSYALELLDDFENYVQDKKWFLFQRARIAHATEKEDAAALTKELFKASLESQDIDFVLEVLSFMVQNGTEEMFTMLAAHAIPLLETEEDFRDLLTLCVDFFHFLDREEDEQQVQQLSLKRSVLPMEQSFDPRNPDVEQLLLLLKGS